MATLSGPPQQRQRQAPIPVDHPAQPSAAKPGRFRNRVEQLMDEGNLAGARRAALASQLQDPDGAYWQGSATPPLVRQVGTDGKVIEFKQTPMQASRWRQRMQQEALMEATPEFRQAAAEVAPRQTAMGYTTLPDVPGVRYANSSRRGTPQPVEDGPIFNPGSINGREVMAPTAGNYGRALDLQRKMGLQSDASPSEFRRRMAELAGEGLSLPDMTYDEQLTAASALASREAAAAQAAEDRKHQRALEVARAGKLSFDEQAALEGLKAQGRGADLPGLNNWRSQARATQKAQAEWDAINAQLVGKLPDQRVMIDGKSRKVGELRAEIGERPTLTSYEDWTTQQMELGDPEFAGESGPAQAGPVPRSTQQALPAHERRALTGYSNEDLEWYAQQYEAQGWPEQAAAVRAMKKRPSKQQAAR